MEFFEKVLNVILSEYGVFVVFLIFAVLGSLYTIKTLWEHNVRLSDKMLDTVENNTRVMAQLVEKLENH